MSHSGSSVMLQLAANLKGWFRQCLFKHLLNEFSEGTLTPDSGSAFHMPFFPMAETVTSDF